MKYYKNIDNCFIRIFMLLFLIIFSYSNTYAQKIIFTENMKLSLGGTIFAGAGMEKHDLFATEDDTATISPGGGFGIDLALGFFITPKLEIDINSAYQSSSLSKKLENADASFSRFYVNTSVKWIIFGRKDYRAWKLGGGIGYYIPFGMNIDWEDLSNLPDGELSIEYSPALGYHIVGEFERFFEVSNWSLSINLTYYFVSYEYSSASAKNVEIVDLKEFETISGNTLNVGLVIKKYF